MPFLFIEVLMFLVCPICGKYFEKKGENKIMIDPIKDMDRIDWKKLQLQPAIAANVANSQVELILLFGKNNNRTWGNKKFRGNFSNYIETKSAAGENKNAKIHNATFPIKLPLMFIVHGYNPNSIILDVFCGSGTTLIACEKTNRRCYGIELDEHYCQVIIDRYKNYTGSNDVELIGNING